MTTPETHRPPPAWRPLVARTSGTLSEGIYGLVLAVSVIAVSREFTASDAGLVALNVFVTAVVFWLAHVYARVLAASIEHHRSPTRSELRALLRNDLPLVEVTIPLVLILLLGTIGLVGHEAAIVLATVVALVELGASGAYAAHLQGAGTLGTILAVLGAVALGAGAALLKVVAHP
jgi:hypothetical protein